LPGSEAAVLQDFPFDQYHFKIITGERLQPPTYEVLNKNGYEFIGKISNFGETLWVHKQHKKELNWTAYDALEIKIY
jgi:hypothetical protein